MEILDLLTPEGVRLEHAGKRQARELARILRDTDRAEILASGGFYDGEAAIRMSINRSEEAYAAYVGSDLLCVFGVSVWDQVQVPWMLGSVHIARYGLTFWRCSKLIVNYLRGKYPLMINMAYGRQTATLSWLARLGFTLSPPEPYGPKGDLFCRATMVTQRLSRDNPSDLSRLREQALKELI